MVDPPTSHTALTCKATVGAAGRVEVTVPLPRGTRVTIFVIEEPTESFDDLLRAAESNLAFWDNPYDDEDWREANLSIRRGGASECYT
jgi:hypothetical protein